MMNNSDDNGVIVVALQRFERQLLPRIVVIREKINDGDSVNEFDIEYLSEALHETRSLLPYMDRHPEYEPLVAKVIHYYKVITDEALANEK